MKQKIDYEYNKDTTDDACDLLLNVVDTSETSEYFYAKGSELLHKSLILHVEWDDDILRELSQIWDIDEWTYYPLTKEILKYDTINIVHFSITPEDEEKRYIYAEVVAMYNPLYECQMYGKKLYVRVNQTLKEMVNSNSLLISKMKEVCPDWYNAREALREFIQQERAKMTPELKEAVKKRDGYKCVECGATEAETILEIDHKVPVSKWGKTEMSNLQCLCYNCNRKKGNKLVYE